MVLTLRSTTAPRLPLRLGTPPPPGLLQGRLPPPRPPRPPPLLAVARWTDALTFPGPKPARLQGTSRTWVAVIDCGLKRASQSLIPSSRCLRPFPPWVRSHTVHCPPSPWAHTTGTTRTTKIDRLACPTPDSLQKPSWKATSAPRNDLVSAILRPWPGTLSPPVIPCLPLPLCVVGSLSVVHPSESQAPGASHREPPPPSAPKHPSTTRSPTTPRAAFLPKVGRTRRSSLVTRHPGPASPPPPSSPQTRRCRLLRNLYRPPPNQPVTRVLPLFFLLPSPTPLANPFKHQPAPDHPRRVSLPSLAALCGS